MSSANPYFSGDEDDDLFVEASKDNAKSNGEFSQDIRDALSQFIESANGNIALQIKEGSGLPAEVDIASNMVSFYCDIISNERQTPVLSALCEVVNKLSEGMLETYIEMHLLRHEIIMYTVVQKYSSLFFNMSDSFAKEDSNNKFKFLLSSYFEYTEWKIERLKKQYVKACEAAGATPEENVLSGEITRTLNASDFILYKAAHILNDFEDIVKKELGKDARGNT